MSIREALEAGLRFCAKYPMTTGTRLRDQFRAALRELDTAKPGMYHGGMVEVCPLCDIADCVHIREQRKQAAAPPSASSQEREELAKWCDESAAILEGIGVKADQHRRVAAILRGERDV